MRLGIHPSQPTYYQTDLKCGDVRIHGQAWRSPWGGPIQHTWPADETPLPPAGAFGFPAGFTWLRPGVYTHTCQGTGTIRVSYPGRPDQSLTFADAGERYPIVYDQPGKFPIFHVDVNNTAMAKTALHDFQVLAPGAMPGELWHPDYLRSLAPFACLRSGGFVPINGSPTTTWDSRPVQHGYEIEAFVDLCNKVHADPWINIPAMTVSAAGPTDYPAGLGGYLAANLDPSLTVYLEYGNEVWNFAPAYTQSTYVLNQSPKVIDPKTGQPYSKGLGLRGAYALFAQQAFAEIMAAAPNIMFKRVCAGCIANMGTMANIDYYNKLYGFDWKWDVVACAPYCWWPDNGKGTYTGPYSMEALQAAYQANPSSAVDLYLQGLASNFPQIATWLGQWAHLAQSWGCELAAYECGGTISAACAQIPALAPLMPLVRSDPRTATFVQSYLQLLAGGGMTLANWLEHCSQTTWGALLNLDDTASAQFAAMTDWAFANRG